LLLPAAPGAAEVGGCVAVALVLVFLEVVVFCRRWSTTAGPLATGFAGAGTSVAPVVAAGVVAVGAGIVVGVLDGAGALVVGVVVVVVVSFVASVVFVSSAGVVVVTVPSPEPVVASAASAPETGPRLAAVIPLPASAETSARHSRLREAAEGVMRRS
jgi:hypothetical protein